MKLIRNLWTYDVTVQYSTTLCQYNKMLHVDPKPKYVAKLHTYVCVATLWCFFHYCICDCSLSTKNSDTWRLSTHSMFTVANKRKYVNNSSQEYQELQSRMLWSQLCCLCNCFQKVSYAVFLTVSKFLCGIQSLNHIVSCRLSNTTFFEFLPVNYICWQTLCVTEVTNLCGASPHTELPCSHYVCCIIDSITSIHNLADALVSVLAHELELEDTNRYWLR